MKSLPFVMLSISLALVDCRAHSQTEDSSQSAADSTNRLIKESSPYLLLHAHNPVDWYPWGQEAIEKARNEDKPIFLSVGYSTCYWCHVMEREVFSDPEIASWMNEWFVNIKVDREERPDVDEIYMLATQLIRQSGGWPNSVFLTPDLKPFFAGTYFPPEDRDGLLGFPTILKRIHDGWLTHREDIEDSAEKLAAAMRDVRAVKRSSSGTVPPPEVVHRAVETLAGNYDPDYGGFGNAPKFPSPANLFLLWEQVEKGNTTAREMVVETLRKMGRGAIYDQIGGGFHRYTLDEKWRIPHFEKMLYDNAHLAELLAVTAEATGDPELERLARGTLEFTLREMKLEGGAFTSAIDAETDGKEGAYYVWTKEELLEALDEEGFGFLAPLFGVDGAPNFEGESYTLYLSAPLDEHAAGLGMSGEQLTQRLQAHLAQLREARSGRKYPLVDDKVLTDWNGMMIAALARASQGLNEPKYLAAARKASLFVLDHLRSKDGKLLHVWRRGKARIPAFMDDYAFLIRGLLALYEVTAEKRWLDESQRLVEEMEQRLRDPNGGYFLGEAHPNLLFQPKSIMDGAIPSGTAIAILDLLSLEEYTKRRVYRQRAQDAMSFYAGEMIQYPAAARTLALAVDRYHRSGVRAAGPASSEPKRPSALSQLAQDVLTAEVSYSGPSLSDGWRPFEMRLQIGEGWHINANPASLDSLVPTQVKGGTRNLVYPKGEAHRFGFAQESLAVYTGEVVLSGELDSKSEGLVLVYQPCDERRCLPQVEKTIGLKQE